MNWKRVEDQLPPEGTCVLLHITLDNWKYKPDPDGVYYVVGWIERGLSQAERDQMKSGAIPDITIPVWSERHGHHMVLRSDTYREADEHANNERPYCWKTFGSCSFFGQEVDYWCEIDRLQP